MQREDFRAFFVMLLVQMQNVIAAISSSSTQVRQQFVCFVLIDFFAFFVSVLLKRRSCSATRRLQKLLAPVWTYDFIKRVLRDALAAYMFRS